MGTVVLEKRVKELEDALKEIRTAHYGEVTEVFPLGSICHECSTPQKIVRWPCAPYKKIDAVLNPTDIRNRPHDEAEQ